MLLPRILTAIIGVPLIIAAIHIGGLVYAAFIGIIIALSLYEYGLILWVGKKPVNRIGLFIFGLLMAAVAVTGRGLPVLGSVDNLAPLAINLTVLSLVLWELLTPSRSFERLAYTMVRRDVTSYRQLPLLLYQFGTKFRDEIRPRFGVMRAREFYMRIRAVTNELSGERIDLIAFSDDPQVMIANALSPAKVSQVKITDKEHKRAVAVVPDDQLAIALGKDWQNIKLASRLTGWEIEARSESQVQDAGKKAQADAINDLTTVEGIGPKLAELLIKAGITDIEKISKLQPSDLATLQGVGEKTAEKIIRGAQKYMHKLARKGIPTKEVMKKVTISSWTNLEWNAPELSFRVECTTGTYVRALAHM